MQKVEFTQEVDAANADLRTKINQFQNALNEVDVQLNTGGAKPAQLLAALQTAAYCEDALGEFGQAFEAEEIKHTEIKDTLKNRFQQKLDAIKSKAISKISSVISDVSGFQDLADQVKEPVTSVSKRSPERIFSGTALLASGPSNFSSARSDAQRAKAEFNEDAFKSYSNIAWWGAGGAAALSWFSGVSFVASLGIGGLVALGAFVLYGSKYNTSAGAIRRLVNAAETEFANIRKEKSDSDTSAQKVFADKSKAEEVRFKSVETSFHETVKSVDFELAELADQLSMLSQKWQDLNGHLFHRHLDGQTAQMDEARSAALGTRFAVLGTAGFSTMVKKERKADADFVGDRKTKAPENEEKKVNKKSKEKNKDKEKSSTSYPNELVLGGIYRGRVNSILPFCALIDFLDFDNGFLFHENIVERKIDHPSEVLYEGQEVWVKYLGLDPGGKKTLSMKDVDQIRGHDKSA